jgi:hypothetical protein
MSVACYSNAEYTTLRVSLLDVQRRATTFQRRANIYQWRVAQMRNTSLSGEMRKACKCLSNNDIDMRETCQRRAAYMSVACKYLIGI